MSYGAGAMAGLSAAIGAGQIIAGGVQNKRNRESQERENEKNRQWEAIMQGRQNSINRVNWEMENAYNSPSNQMKLLKEAGLDPNLVYANQASWQGQSIGSVTGSASNQQAPQTDLSGVMAGMEKFKDAGQMFYEVKQLEAAKANIEADTSLKNAQSIETLSKTDLNRWDYKFKQGVESVMKQKLIAEKDLINAQSTNVETQSMKNVAETKVILERNEREKITAALQNSLVKQQTEESKKRTALLVQEVITEKLQQEMSRTQNRVQLQEIQKKMQEVNTEQVTQNLIKAQTESIKNKNSQTDDFLDAVSKIIPGISIIPGIFPKTSTKPNPVGFGR